MDFLESEKLLNNQQYGFRRKRSTKMAATLLSDRIRREVDSGKLVGAIYLDLTKAFDTIGHNVLINKLPTFGINGRELSWLTDYLFNRSQIVECSGHRSNKEHILTGVPQGSILGPLLFIMFYNDLTDHVHHADIIMYADDTVLTYADKDPTKIEVALNKDMVTINDFCTENELIVNTKKGKTEVMLFGTSKRLKLHGKSLEIYYADKLINFVTSYKYLGVVVDNMLTLNENFTKAIKRPAHVYDSWKG